MSRDADPTAVMNSSALFAALPVTSPYIRVGSATNCGGYAGVRISLAVADGYELVNVAPPREDRWRDPEWTAEAAEETGDGVVAELVDLFGELPAVRVTILEVLADPLGTSPMNRLAGRYALRQSLHDAGLPVAAPEPYQGYRVIRP